MFLFRWIQCKLEPANCKYAFIWSDCSVKENCWNMNSSCCYSLWEEANLRPCNCLWPDHCTNDQLVKWGTDVCLYLPAQRHTNSAFCQFKTKKTKNKYTIPIASIHSYTHSSLPFIYMQDPCNEILKNKVI